MTEQQAWEIYQQQLIMDERDRQLRNVVTVLQGLAAIVSIVAFIAVFRKKA